MSASGDPQDQAESLDQDKVDDRDDYTGDRADDDDYPPERPLGVDEDVLEPSAAENVAAWARREEPDPLVAELEREAAERAGPGRTSAERMLDDLDVDVPDDDGELDDLDRLVLEEEVLATELEYDDEGRGVGVIADPTPGFDDEEQAVALEGVDTGDETAEEAAMHIEHER